MRRLASFDATHGRTMSKGIIERTSKFLYKFKRNVIVTTLQLD
jgi:hypothetical protein